MNPAHVHLLTNHLPILGTAFSVLLLVVAHLRRSDEVARVGLGFFVVTALASWPAYLSGEGAEELVEHLPGVSHDLIEAHEEAAFIALMAVAAAGVLSLWTLWRARRGAALSRRLLTAVVVLGVVAGGLMAWTGWHGGKIRHTELHEAAAAAPQS